MRDGGREAQRFPGAGTLDHGRSEVLAPYPALAGLRVGCVKYLNARPLIYGYEGPVCFDHPSGLARDLERGALDAALVPVFEALGERHYLIADGAAIACDGPVYSVFLAHEGDVKSIRSVALDPASLTSVNLLRVLLREFYGLQPEYLDAAKVTGEPDARLLIGNQAIEFRSESPNGYRYLDLGEEWKRQTGLPFVFAMWLLRPDLPNAASVAADFRALKRDGVAHIPQIVRDEKEATLDFRRRYLTQHIRFDFGARERAGMERFRELLVKHGVVGGNAEPLEFV